MGQDRKPRQNTRGLRERAEARLTVELPSLPEMSPEEIRAMVHELQVHQIELERQNDELRQALVGLEESSQRYSDLYDFSPVGFLTLDKSGTIKQANLTAAQQLGVDRNRLINKPFLFFIEAGDVAVFRNYLQRIFREQQHQLCEVSLQGQDAQKTHVLLDSIAVTDPSGKALCRTSITDLSELKQAERQLQERQGMFAIFIGHLPSVAVIRDLDGRYLFANEAWEKTFHKTREEWLGKTTDDLWPPEVAVKFREQDRLVLETGKALQSLGTLRQDDGLHHWITYRFPIVDQDGQPIMIGINGIDITEHLETKARLEHLLASSPAAVYTCEPQDDFPVTYISENVKALVGWEPRQFLEDPRFWIDHVHPEDRPRSLQQLALPWPRDHQRQEYRFLAQDGAYHWMHDEFKLVRDQDGKPVEIIGAWMDITERKALEAQLLQAQKMEAVGRLAGGVAHDFNNLLMAIMGYGDLMRSSLLEADPLYHYVEDILKAADRAASLTQQLLAFSRRQVMQPQVVNLNRVAADLEKMLRRLIEEHIDLEIVAAPDLGMVKADPGQLGQIIMNLAVNARDAMPTGGRLTLTTANIDLAARHKCYGESAPPGPYVMLTVSDTGGGMDAATLTHIFEPFFTTKEVGKGTGLGLPMVYGIVKQNGGCIEVDSRPGQGTTFRIYLPRLEAAVEAPRARMTPAEKLEGSETILVVEDEDALRTLLCRFFRLYGYNVLEARHGGEALLICERHQGPIHLMVTDVVMPQMSGQKLADRLAPLHPEMMVFYMSGYMDSDLAPYGVQEPSKLFIPKPFRPMDLVKKVREFLDASRRFTGDSPPA